MPDLSGPKKETMVMISKLVLIPADGATLAGDLVTPDRARAVVLFTHGSGSSRHSPVFAVISRGGRRDVAGDALEQVCAPVLLLVGARDREVFCGSTRKPHGSYAPRTSCTSCRARPTSSRNPARWRRSPGRPGSGATSSYTPGRPRQCGGDTGRRFGTPEPTRSRLTPHDRWRR